MPIIPREIGQDARSGVLQNLRSAMAKGSHPQHHHGDGARTKGGSPHHNRPTCRTTTRSLIGPKRLELALIPIPRTNNRRESDCKDKHPTSAVRIWHLSDVFFVLSLAFS